LRTTVKSSFFLLPSPFRVGVPGLQEGPHPLDPGLAVDVLVVVADRVERDELLAPFLRPVAEELVEHFLPGRVVHLRGLGDHPVHVEQARGDRFRQS
jgi:hypothetical protein